MAARLHPGLSLLDGANRTCVQPEAVPTVGARVKEVNKGWLVTIAAEKLGLVQARLTEEFGQRHVRVGNVIDRVKFPR